MFLPLIRTFAIVSLLFINTFFLHSLVRTMKMLFIIAIHALLLAGDVPQFQHLRKLMFWSVENYILVSDFFENKTQNWWNWLRISSSECFNVEKPRSNPLKLKLLRLVLFEWIFPIFQLAIVVNLSFQRDFKIKRVIKYFLLEKKKTFPMTTDNCLWFLDFCPFKSLQ